MTAASDHGLAVHGVRRIQAHFETVVTQSETVVTQSLTVVTQSETVVRVRLRVHWTHASLLDFDFGVCVIS